MKKPEIDPEKCIGCGACASLCSEVFALDGKTNVAKVLDADYEANKECIENAIDSCPAGAIK